MLLKLILIGISKKNYDDLIKQGLKNVALTSNNPSYNPYHRDLIKYNLNEIDKELYNKFLRENEDKGKDFKECDSFQLTEGSTYTCSVAYTNEVQDTISISNSRGTSYHKSYG
ncbi:hypothetical protein H8356DRAFT_1404570 [Neocallimastix lanati (nom. inval.)]|uniref:Uncharacterized protein n=1 Tax=Neocallimastix californiae TaxID=1754190 RepID=A0A1Y2B522_9FUNG|nr:hypothetical protein H8356DRAFT_1404570 [Neocallimastix sp. JGI-2020a]ORY29834.1 hypothetical protein LY90DRAFT_512762 [Neocallimastix californiae]|eukprot:ORY29834.1 hypothetical protein LY90DRAFT_512762 [Neocallimastix californiae]